MIKFTKLLLLGVIILFTFAACDDSPSGNQNDDPIPPSFAEVLDIEFTIPDSTELVNYSSEQVDYNGLMVTGYTLDQFVNMDSVNVYIDEDDFDGRKLFAFEIVSSDEDGNWSPRDNDYYDLSWADFASGYLLPDEKGRTYFANDNILSGYNVKWAYYIRLYRRMDVTHDGITTIFETGSFETEGINHQAGNGNFYTDPGFAITNFISDFIIQDPEDYEYQFTSVYDESIIYSWEDLQSAYWLTTQNKAVFLNEDGTEFLSSFKKLIKIDLVEIQR
ncbi:MAG: hypothetical protein HOK80_04535 [Candidatus Cloacimonetes bacterium]|nr:hypothetical protein [Candidatus Cloacimonadota bacterium]MBT4332076.1 hypothetical protein [Candidatus Cloacimonadota bacterium]MBT4576642.1 hypothetical protein [Candidatus Cloacimonadota bacterium]MBT5420135.1 hypothetical protein [Candidatus Cloacimonadota bacterium]